MKKQILMTVVLTITSFLGVSQQLDREYLDRYFDTLAKHEKFMGSVAISKEGTLIYSRTVGYSDVERAIQANDKTQYRIGSITKTFTAALVMKAVEEKKLRLDQTLDTWFPDIPNAKTITISHLLNHRSGLGNFTDKPNYYQWHTTPKSEQEMLDIIIQAGVDFTPDEKAEYSNSNYVLLSYLLEKAYTTSYSKIIEKHISKPLGLVRTSVFDAINTDNNEAHSYTYSNGWKLDKETHHTVPIGAGAIRSTPQELLKFSDALFAGKIVSKQSLEEMKKIKDDYGYGLFSMPFYEAQALGHTGGIDSFRSVFAHFDKGNYSIALVTNGSQISSNNVAIAMLSIMFEKPFEIPSYAYYEHSNEELKAFEGIYSSKQVPLKITIRLDNNSLYAQATGQFPFQLEPVSKGTFAFKTAGIEIVFNTASKSMEFKQGGAQILFEQEATQSKE